MSEIKSDKLTPVTATTTTFGDSGDKLLFATGTNLDMNGVELILDADADTSITADTDDQIDIKIAGADDFQFTANTFTAQSGSTIAAQALTATLITPSLPITYSSATGITAGTTQTQAGGTALTKEINIITTVGTNLDAVTLPTAVAGMTVKIYNKDASEHLRVWPFSGDAIDGASANAVDGNVIFAGGWREYTAYDATNWVTTAQSAMFNTGVITRDLTTAAGDLAVTGVLFKPTSIIAFSGSNIDDQASMGAHASSSNTEMGLRYMDNAQNASAVYALTWNATTLLATWLESGAGGWTYSTIALGSYDTDGFTLTWEKTGTPTGSATVGYFVSRI